MKPRANLIAVIVASPPVFINLTLSIEGKFPIINFDNSISDAVGVQYNVPFESCLVTEVMISFRLWPKSNAPYALQKSM